MGGQIRGLIRAVALGAAVALVLREADRANRRLAPPGVPPTSRIADAGSEHVQGEIVAGVPEGEVGDRGRLARHPLQLTRRAWKDIAYRVKDELSEDNVFLISAGIAFFGFMAMFPTLVAFVSLYGLVADFGEVTKLLNSLAFLLPKSSFDFISQFLLTLTSKPNAKLSIGFGVSLVLALWSSSRGVTSMIDGLNIIYDEKEKRGWFRYNLTALALTATLVALLVVSLAAIIGAPLVFTWFGLENDLFSELLAIARWPVLVALTMLSLAVLYRFGPSRHRPRWSWVSWGAAVATLLWIGASALFSLYAANFGDYDKTYGSAGAIVALLLWIQYGCFVVLLGAELNAEMEHQTARDTTEGIPKPLGARGATMADTLGRARA